MSLVREAFFELSQFVGYFLSIGAIGFRYGVIRRIRGISDEARGILHADNAAMLGVMGVLFLYLSFLGGPWAASIAEHKTYAESLPKNLGQFEFRMAMLALALVGFLLVRVSSGFGWGIATLGMLVVTLMPLYTARGPAGRVNAVHILAASTWLGTLLVLTIVGIRGVIRAGLPGVPRAELVADLVNSFSPLALTAAAVVALTGLTTAWLHLKRISSLWTTSYGAALIVKLIFVLGVVLMGAWNWRRMRPGLGESGSEERMQRSAVTELTFGALVLVTTAVLVSLPSPK
jgi:putative copper export protein